MKNKFNIDDVVFFPIFSFEGYFKEIKSGTICSVKRSGDTFLYQVDGDLYEYKEGNILCKTLEDAEKIAVKMVLADVRKRYGFVEAMCKKYNMLKEL